MGARLRFKVFSLVALLAGAATGLAVACGGDNGPTTCDGTACDGGTDSTTTDGSAQQDGNTPGDGSSDAGLDADADASVIVNCGDGAPGTLDETFGDGGIVVLPLTGANARAVAVQPDGKIIVVGKSQTDAGAAAFALVRLNADGSLDPSFGSGGAVERVVGDTTHLLTAVGVQADGKIVAVGYTRTTGSPTDFNFAVLRHLANGTADPAFGDAGVVLTDFANGHDLALSVALMPDGRIVVGGQTVSASLVSDMAFARYMSDGSLDTTFGSGGQVMIAIRGADDARSIALVLDGGVLAAGTSQDSSGHVDVAAARLDGTGSLDTSFADAGRFLTNFGGVGSDTAESVALDLSGRAILAGLRNGADFGVLRLTTTGNLDPAFGIGGTVSTDFAGRNDDAFAALIQGDGRVAVAGSSLTGSTTDARIGVVRYLPDGELDNAFGMSGMSLTPLPAGFSGSNVAQGAALTSCSLVVVGLWSDPGPVNRMGAVRYRR